MSSLFGLGGKKKAVAPPPALVPGAMAAITEHMETLTKKEDHLEKKIRALQMKAVELNKSKRATDKRQAINKMKEIKMYQTQLQQTRGMYQNMMSQRFAIEGQGMTEASLKVMEKAKEAMKQGIDIDHAEDILLEAQEGMERQAELADALSRPLDGGGMPVDEDDLMQELLDLEGDFAEEEADAAPVADLSSLGPTATGPVGGQTVEQMMAELDAAPTAAPTIASSADAELADLLDFAN